MKKIQVFIFAIFVSLTWLSGCKTVQQAPVITKTEEEVIADIPKEQGVTFFEGTLQAGLEKAKTENKLIFVDCYTTWCGPCKTLKTIYF